MNGATLFPSMPTNRTKLDVWKERHGVWTHNSGALDGDRAWLAVAAKQFIADLDVEKDEATNLFELMANYCRLIDELGYNAEAADEESACFALAQKRGLPWLESITQKDLWR